MPERIAENVSLSNACCHCGRRLWFNSGEKLSRRRYIPPAWFRRMFKSRLGVFPLGYFRIARCEVCGRTMAIFDRNYGTLHNDVVVLYACTLLSKPLDEKDGHSCAMQISCYGCPLKDSEDYVDKK